MSTNDEKQLADIRKQIEGLQAEATRLENKLGKPPKPQGSIDWNPVLEMASIHVERVAFNYKNDIDMGCHSDFHQYMFETVMRAIYGEDFFGDWYNRVVD